MCMYMYAYMYATLSINCYANQKENSHKKRHFQGQTKTAYLCMCTNNCCVVV